MFYVGPILYSIKTLVHVVYAKLHSAYFSNNFPPFFLEMTMLYWSVLIKPGKNISFIS